MTLRLYTIRRRTRAAKLSELCGKHDTACNRAQHIKPEFTIYETDYDGMISLSTKSTRLCCGAAVGDQGYVAIAAAQTLSVKFAAGRACTICILFETFSSMYFSDITVYFNPHYGRMAQHQIRPLPPNLLPLSSFATVTSCPASVHPNRSRVQRLTRVRLTGALLHGLTAAQRWSLVGAFLTTKSRNLGRHSEGNTMLYRVSRA